MGNNSSSLQSKTSSTNMGKSNDLINKLFEHNNVDSLNMTEFNTNKGGSSIPVIRVSHLPQIGGAVQPVANKYSNEFINKIFLFTPDMTFISKCILYIKFIFFITVVFSI